MTLEFPRTLLREKSHSWNLVGTAAAPGLLSNNVFPMVRTDGGGLWTCSMNSVSLSGIKDSAFIGRQRQREAGLLWRAVRQVCNGGVNPIIVPRNDALFVPWPPGVARDAGVTAHSDGSFFSDSTGYYQSVIVISCNGGASLRATTMNVNLTYTGDLQGGESFSIEHPTLGWRLYEISTIFAVSAGVATISFNPPLREAIADGTVMEFDRPRCLMRLKTPSSMDLTVEPWTFNSASVEFIEAFS